MAGLLGWAPGLTAQTAQDIIRAAIERNDSRTTRVYNYTVVHDFRGFESESYFERADVGGRWVFVPAVTATDLGGQEVRQETVRELGTSAWADPFGYLERWAAAATSEGTQAIGGVNNWVVRIDDFLGAHWGLTPGTYADGAFEPNVGRLYFDTRTYLVNRFDVTGTLLQQDGVARPVRIVANMADYRTIEGLTHPFTLDLEVYGLGPGGAEMASAAVLLDDLRRQLAELGEQERAEVQALIDQQLALFEAELAGVAPLRMTARVLDIRVNEGPSR